MGSLGQAHGKLGAARQHDLVRRLRVLKDIVSQPLPAVRHNEFFDNSFVDNEEQVAVAGGGRLRENDWTVGDQGNYWSDYAGYDADGDGLGDIEYKSERLFENLMSQEPNLRFFLYSPATNAIDFSARAFPLVKPQPKLTDTQPLMAPRIPADAPALPQTAALDWVWPAVVAVGLAIVLALLPRLGRQRYRFYAVSERDQ